MSETSNEGTERYNRAITELGYPKAQVFFIDGEWDFDAMRHAPLSAVWVALFTSGPGLPHPCWSCFKISHVFIHAGHRDAEEARWAEDCYEGRCHVPGGPSQPRILYKRGAKDRPTFIVASEIYEREHHE